MRLPEGRFIAALIGVALATSAPAQDFPDVQRLANRVLFAREEMNQRQRDAEKRRVDELDRRAQEQALLLQQQAASVRQLGSELQSIRDERQIIDVVDSFESALAAGRSPLARALLSTSVTVDLAQLNAAGGVPMTADALIPELSALAAAGGVSPRSNQHVRVDGDRATLTADGFAWGHADRSGKALDSHAGQYEYGFQRTADGWRIDAVRFRRAAAM